jgi:outer membrane protein assembly factor BamD (BamD/ComL family)
MNARRTCLAALAAAALAAALGSCATAPKEIPSDLSAQTLVQRAQEASDAYNYKAAVAYYRALKERFGDDPVYLCAADYEIAFIAYKQGRYGEAKAGLEALLASYTASGAETLPPRYRILAEKVLEKIAAETAPKQ